MPSAAQVTEPDACPAPGADDGILMEWVNRQHEHLVGWSDMVQQATAAGHTLSEEALRCRYRRWRQKVGQNAGATPHE